MPAWKKEQKANNFRANFISVWARKNIDTALYETIKKNWLNGNKFKLSLMDPPIPKIFSDMTRKQIKRFKLFFRSDHFSFWYPTGNDTINAVLLADLGVYRNRTKNTYHSERDNKSLLTEENLAFLKNGIDSLLQTLIDIGEGICPK